MSIVELAADLQTSTRVVKRMIAQGIIPPIKKGGPAAPIRVQLSRKHQLTVPQLLAVLHGKVPLASLGPQQPDARAQIAELGPFKRDAAPKTVTDALGAAEAGDPAAVAVLMAWLKGILPPTPVRHHWVAVRLLINNPSNHVRRNANRVFRALENVRKHPDFEYWGDFVRIGSQIVIVYARPMPPYNL